MYLYVLDLVSNIVLFHAAFPQTHSSFNPWLGLPETAVTGELILPQVIEAATRQPRGRLRGVLLRRSQ